MLAYRNPSNEDSDSIFNYTLKLDAYLFSKNFLMYIFYSKRQTNNKSGGELVK